MLYSGLSCADELPQNRTLQEKIVNRQGKRIKMFFLLGQRVVYTLRPTPGKRSYGHLVFHAYSACLKGRSILLLFLLPGCGVSLSLGRASTNQWDPLCAQWWSYFLHKMAGLGGQLQMKSLQAWSLAHAESCSAQRGEVPI